MKPKTPPDSQPDMLLFSAFGINNLFFPLFIRF